MIRKRVVLYLLLPILGFSIGYLVKTTIITKPVAIENSSVEETKENIIPECFADICPRYLSMDVDGNNSSSESVVVTPTRMTQGAGKIMIIKKGKVIFESSEMPNIGIESVEDGDGFVVTYSSSRDENGNRMDYNVRYRYRDGQFVADGGQWK